MPPVLIALLQYRWLSKDYPDTGRLRLAYKVKGTIAILLILLSIGFGVAMYRAGDVGGQFLTIISFPTHADRLSILAAVLEWVIAIGFTFYLLSYFWDLRLSKPGKLSNSGC